MAEVSAHTAGLVVWAVAVAALVAGTALAAGWWLASRQSASQVDEDQWAGFLAGHEELDDGRD